MQIKAKMLQEAVLTGLEADLYFLRTDQAIDSMTAFITNCKLK